MHYSPDVINYFAGRDEQPVEEVVPHDPPIEHLSPWDEDDLARLGIADFVGQGATVDGDKSPIRLPEINRIQLPRS